MASVYLNHIDCELIAFEMAHGCIMKIVDRRRNRERTKRYKTAALSRSPVLEGSMQTFNKSTFNHELNRIEGGQGPSAPLAVPKFTTLISRTCCQRFVGIQPEFFMFFFPLINWNSFKYVISRRRRGMRTVENNCLERKSDKRAVP